MIPTSFMLIAGEASGDRLAAELVESLRDEWRWRDSEGPAAIQPRKDASGPIFFGAGGAAMSAAGVEIVEDMSQRGVIGVSAVAGRLMEFARLMNRLVKLASDRQPDVIICVDYGGFNLRLQARIRRLIHARKGPFNNWQPKLVQFVSPQVWGSRPRRAFRMEKNLDLLISILPFEKTWFAQRTPRLNVEFVGHPLIGRHAGTDARPPQKRIERRDSPLVALLPGSRRGELRHHLPVLKAAVQRIREQADNCRFKLVVPNQELAALTREFIAGEPIEIVVGELGDVLNDATIAISKTGTITLELALFGVPAVTFYKTTSITYWVARWLVTVKWLSMPNLLANAPIFPEFVQGAATSEALAKAALDLLLNAGHRSAVSDKLRNLLDQLGSPGAPDRAATAVLNLF